MIYTMNYLCGMTIQEKIRETREAKRLSQYDMADKLGISQSAYLQIEKGKTDLTINRLYKIAEILDVAPLFLMGAQSYVTDDQMNSIEEYKEMIKKISLQNQKLMDYVMYFIKLQVGGQNDEKLMKEFMKETEDGVSFLRESLKSLQSSPE